MTVILWTEGEGPHQRVSLCAPLAKATREASTGCVECASPERASFLGGMCRRSPTRQGATVALRHTSRSPPRLVPAAMEVHRGHRHHVDPSIEHIAKERREQLPADHVRASLIELDPHEIIVNVKNPRERARHIEELKDSLSQIGLLDPIVVSLNFRGGSGI